jgi:hypothetical protein
VGPEEERIMKRALIVALVAGAGLVSGLAAADKKGGDKKGAAAAPAKPSCGQMMKETAALPRKFAEFMNALAEGANAHAAMLTGKDAASVAEAAAMKKVAADHKALADAATKTANDMEAMGTLAAVPNEPKPDAKAMEMMTRNNALEKEMANMMLKHAEDMEKKMAEMKSAK